MGEIRNRHGRYWYAKVVGAGIGRALVGFEYAVGVILAGKLLGVL